MAVALSTLKVTYLFLDFLARLGKILPGNFDYAGREINAVDSDAKSLGHVE
jgi:hypothetical protein